MFTITSSAIAVGLMVPALLAPAPLDDSRPARLPHRSADDRAVARLVDAAQDYVAFGKTGALFNLEVADVLRFRLRFTRWLYRYDPVETLSEPAPVRYTKRTFDTSILNALPRLPDQIEYRLYGRHLLLVDRHTRQVIDVLDDAMGR